MQQAKTIDAVRGTPAERGYDLTWRKVRDAYLRAHRECELCGAPANEVDHIMPIRRGGTHDAENLQALCHACHSRKTATYDNRWGRR